MLSSKYIQTNVHKFNSIFTERIWKILLMITETIILVLAKRRFLMDLLRLPLVNRKKGS